VAFDLGVLQDYLDVQAGPALLDRAECVRDWGSTRPSVFRLAETRSDRLVVHDQVSGHQGEVVHTGEALGTSIGEWVLGRVVPAGEDSGWRSRLGCLSDQWREPARRCVVEEHGRPSARTAGS